MCVLVQSALGHPDLSPALQISAFKNTDGSVSVQMINTASSSQAVTVSTSGGGFTATTVQAYITNNSNNNINSMTASISGGAVSATVPGLFHGYICSHGWYIIRRWYN